MIHDWCAIMMQWNCFISQGPTLRSGKMRAMAVAEPVEVGARLTRPDLRAGLRSAAVDRLDCNPFV